MLACSELGGEQRDRRQVDRPLAEQVEDDWIPPSRPGRLDATVRGVLGEVKDLREVGKEGRASFGEIQLSLVQDGQVGDEHGGGAPLMVGQLFDTRDKFVIGEPPSTRHHPPPRGHGLRACTRRFCAHGYP